MSLFPEQEYQVVERFTGVYNTYLEHAPTLAQVLPDFVEFAKDSILVTHAGYEFDLPLLMRECQRNGLNMLPNLCLDTKALFSYLYSDFPDIIWTDYLLNYHKIDHHGLRRYDGKLTFYPRSELEDSKF